MRVALLLSGALLAVYIKSTRYFKLKTARTGQKIRTIVEQAAKGNLNDRIVHVMLGVLSSEDIGLYKVDKDLVEQAGHELANYGTPHSCLLAIHISNYTGVGYSTKVTENIRDAACHFPWEPNYSEIARVIDIVRGKYLYEDSICQDSPRQTEITPAYHQ
jgi:hypothetical protein